MKGYTSVESCGVPIQKSSLMPIRFFTDDNADADSILFRIFICLCACKNAHTQSHTRIHLRTFGGK